MRVMHLPRSFRTQPVFATLSLGLCLLAHAHGADKGPQVGSKVGNFTGKDTKGKVVKLATFKGKVVLLNFGASW